MGWRKKQLDTGIWDISTLAADVLVSGKLYAQRVGNTVFIRGDNLKLGEVPAGATYVTLIPSGGIPAGMRPAISMWSTFQTASGKVRNAAVASHGWLPIYWAKTGDEMHFQIIYGVSGAFPENMPGVKVA